MMRVLDLFSGTGSSTAAFEDAGCDVVRVELDQRHDADLYADVRDLDATDLGGPGAFDFVWASPPCTAFSVASMGHHWGGGFRCYQPLTDGARLGLELARHTVELIDALAPRWWVIENPRGLLRKLDPVAGLTRRTVTYCAYGDFRMKPTDLWGGHPAAWIPRERCTNGATCHEAAPRGSKTGTQGLGNAVDRSRVPYELSRALYEAARVGLERGTRALLPSQQRSLGQLDLFGTWAAVS